MMYTSRHNVDVRWRVWVLPDTESWKLASGPAMKNNREARKVTLDADRYARLLDGALSVHEPLERESDALKPAA